MGVTRQLNQLQDLDQQIDAAEQALKQKMGQVGESDALKAARTNLASAQEQLDGLKREQKSAETEITDLSARIKTVEEKLYGGKIRNPKELTDLQHDSALLKGKRDPLESRVLELMDLVETAKSAVSSGEAGFKRAENEWHGEQQQLTIDIEQAGAGLADLKERRKVVLESIEPDHLALYEKLRKQKGKALATIEQGICRGCRISLSANEIKQARSGHPVQCSSCGRILYLP